MIILLKDLSFEKDALALAEKTGFEIKTDINEMSENVPAVIFSDEGVYLFNNGMKVKCDFSGMLPRLNEHNLNKELLVRASGIKSLKSSTENMPEIIDATAGMGQDSLLLAAAGCHVIMYENDPVIAAMLRDCLRRAKNDPQLCHITRNMDFYEGNSIEFLNNNYISCSRSPDIIYLDPMFPERTKTGLVKKKFQLIHILEKPCDNEEELLDAAIKAKPKRIIIKRPLKGSILAGQKPSFSIKGKSVRYDCIVL